MSELCRFKRGRTTCCGTERDVAHLSYIPGLSQTLRSHRFAPMVSDVRLKGLRKDQTPVVITVGWVVPDASDVADRRIALAVRETIIAKVGVR